MHLDKVKGAFSFYTGGAFTPHLEGKVWAPLLSWMEENNVDPYEFCYFCMTELDPDKPVSPLMLQRRNYIVMQKVRDAFIAYRRLRKEHFGLIVKMQSQHADSMLSLYGSWDSLLDSPDVLLAEYVRLELMFEYVSDQKVRDRILERNIGNLKYVWNGVPELEELCPRVAKYFSAKETRSGNRKADNGLRCT